MRVSGVILFLAAFAVCRASSVIPPSFDDLVQGSTLVFRGRVTDVHVGVSGEAGQRHTATFVKFAVERLLKGSAESPITLEFMGGEVAGRGLFIAGLPRFVPGERGIFFVENRGGRVCPIMRLRHGRYRIGVDAASGIEHVARDDGSPLNTVAQVSAALRHETRIQSDISSAGMELGAFENAITSRVAPSASGAAAR